jgi:predicted alpha/beta hydrolase family esterase
MTEPITVTILRGGLRVLGKAAPSVASRVAETLFTTPRRYSTPDREREAMKDATPFAIPFEGMNIRAWRWGSGPIVLLAHGWEGRGSQMSPFAAPIVAGGMSVVTYDGPAHGRSSGSRTTLPQFAAALRTVADFVGPVEAIIAHSFGCAATTLAIHDGLHVERVVFVAPPVDPGTYTRRFGEFFGLDDRIVEGMKARIERRFHRKWTDFSVAKMAANMTAPLLVIHDRDDDEIHLHEAEKIVGCWPASELVVTEGLGHRRILRDESVTRTAADFVTRASGRARRSG